MTWKTTARIFALGWLVAALPAVATAQGGGDSGATSGKKQAESSEKEGETSGSDSSASGEKGAAKEKESDEAADEGETSSASKKKGAESGSTAEKEGKSGSKSAAEKGEAAKSGAKTPEEGPGGKKLRQDYPGTEKSKKGQMETDRIEGLKFKEGQEPGKAYDVKIQQLETKVDDLKEKVFQSKSRVVLLKETVLGGNLSGSRAMIVHADDLGNKFKLKRAMYSLDGNRVFNESRKTGKLKGKKFKVYDGSISAGAHNVSILLEYQGSGYGVFNYMKGYNMRITSSCQFDVKPGKATILRVRTVKKGGAFRDAAKNPSVKCEIETTDVSKQQVQGSKKGQSSGGASKSSGTGGSK